MGDAKPTKEYDYLKVGAPEAAEPSLMDKLAKEWKLRWWLWSVVLFAIVVCGGLFMFRGSLYTQNAGMPLLAVTENAQELCDSKCADEVGFDEEGNPKNREQYESCLASCVKGETEQVADERKDFAEEQKKEAAEEKKEEEKKAEDAKPEEQKQEEAKKAAEEQAEKTAEAVTAAEGGARKLRRLRLLL